MYIPSDTLRRLCIQKQWFTDGTNSQYEKLFDMNRNGASVKELALIIWVCSDAEQHSRESIQTALTECHNRIYPN